MMRSELWKRRSKCQKDGVHPDFFYPSGNNKGRSGNLEQVQAERARYCHGIDDDKPCPVRLDCLEYAILNNLDDGVWGGTTEVERIRLRRQRKRTTA